MSSQEAKNDLEVMVLMGLAEIWKKVAEHPAATEEVRAQALELIEKFNELLPVRGKGTRHEHYGGEQLLTRMARSLPHVLD
jgi:hypothetical protein